MDTTHTRNIHALQVKVFSFSSIFPLAKQIDVCDITPHHRNEGRIMKDEIKDGGEYIARVAGCLCRVRILRRSPTGGWYAERVSTGRMVIIDTVDQVQSEVVAS